MTTVKRLRSRESHKGYEDRDTTCVVCGRPLNTPSPYDDDVAKLAQVLRDMPMGLTAPKRAEYILLQMET